LRRLCVAFLLLAAACGGSTSPASPTPTTAPPAAFADFSGLWTGSYNYTSCLGDHHCNLRIGTSQAFDLRIDQTGSRVRGLFTQWEFAAELSGDVRDDGTVTLSGEAPQASEKDSGMTVSRIVLRLSADRVLQGTIAYQTRSGIQYAEFSPGLTVEGEIASARREDLRAFVAIVDGTWSGRFAIRGCTPVGGSPFCTPHEDRETARLELTLSRSGESLSGTLAIGADRIPVTGRIAGTTVALSGETDVTASGGPGHVRVTSLNASIDSLGRLVGTFRYESVFPAAAPTSGETANAELWQVVRSSN